jgi:hypothetical protein
MCQGNNSPFVATPWSDFHIAGIKEGKEKEAVAMYNEIMETIFKYSYTPVMLVLEGTTIDGEKLKEMADIIKDSIKTRPSYGKHNI